MGTSRRSFLKSSGAVAAGAAMTGLARPDEVVQARGPTISLKKRIGEVTTICPFCGVGCGMIAAAEKGHLVNVEGDPDHPINQGALCSKGAGVVQLSSSERRVKEVMYRAPGSTEWEIKSWDWALDAIADRVKATRDANWIAKDDQGRMLNRTEAIGCLGGVAINNEECYTLVKAMRALGLVYVEHQARL